MGQAASDESLVVTLIGSGNSAHVCAALFEDNSKGRVRTQILTSCPEQWSRTPRVRLEDDSVQTGKIHLATKEVSEAIPGSDIVIWTGPVYATKNVFERIEPHVDRRRTVVGTIFAQGLCHLLAHRVFGADVKFFTLRNIPWLCRKVEHGALAQIVGSKTEVDVVIHNLDEAWVKRDLEPLFAVEKKGRWEPKMALAGDFCPVVFNPANQIIHPAAYWGLFRFWKGEPLSGDAEPCEWLYRGMSEAAGETLQALDNELQLLKNAYKSVTGRASCDLVVPLSTRLCKQYGDQIEDGSTMARMVGTNSAYRMAKTPVKRSPAGVMPDPNHRVVLDDIGWGLCVQVSIAERLEAVGVSTPTTTMRAMIEWHQKMMGKEFLVDGKLRGRDCDSLVLLGTSDALELVAAIP